MSVEVTAQPTLLAKRALTELEQFEEPDEVRSPKRPKRSASQNKVTDEEFYQSKEEEKKRKAQEKAEKQREREEAKKQKKIEKKQREEERVEKQRQKELEKQKREEERIQKQKEREQEKLRKEEEKQQRALEKEAEKKRKEEERILKKKQQEEERLEKQRQREEEKLQREREKKEAKAAAKREKEQKRIEEEHRKQLELEQNKKQALNLFGVKVLTKTPSVDLKPLQFESVTTLSATGKHTIAPILAKKCASPTEIDLQMKENWTNEQIQEFFAEYYTRKNFPLAHKQKNTFQKEHPSLSCWKAFSFEERAPFAKTFSKRSDCITPRRPFVRDEKLFDYELDSDEEWEEGGGEDIANSDEELDQDPMDLEEYDEFLVPDGYLSDEEGLGERCNSTAGASGVSLSGKKPYCTEMLYSAALCAEFPVVPIGRVLPISEATIKEEASKNKTVSKLLRPVTDEALPDLIKLLHNSPDGVLKIVTCFKTKHPEVSKRQIERKMKELATKTSGRWQLNNEELRKKYCPPDAESEPIEPNCSGSGETAEAIKEKELQLEHEKKASMMNLMEVRVLVPRSKLHKVII